MLFSSITFIYFFLPFMAIYYLLPKRLKNAYLLITSLFFYFFGEPVYVLLLLFSSVSDWLHGLYIDAHRKEKSAKTALASSIIVNLLLLGFFKYTDFIIETINVCFGTQIPVTGIPLPVGISFFTFQTMSYTIDVYRGRAKLQRNFATFMTYVCLFPQLIAGPIVRYTDVERELEKRKCTMSGVSDGIIRFCAGLGKKVLIANLLGEFCTHFTNSPDKSVLFYWAYAIAFAMQVYFDFSGYSDMAIGLGKILGFDFMENFNYPYRSKSMTEFWRRWHMSLGSWFRDYVYIPLGGSRVGTVRRYLNILIVWMMTGFWHGAEWNFVIWGLFYALFLMIEKAWLLPHLEENKIWPNLYLMFVVMTGFVIFNAANMTEAAEYLGGMFGILGYPVVTGTCFYYIKSYFILLSAGVIGAVLPVKEMYRKVTDKIPVLEPVVFFAGVILSAAFLVDGSFNPFLYFRF